MVNPEYIYSTEVFLDDVKYLYTWYITRDSFVLDNPRFEKELNTCIDSVLEFMWYNF